VINEFEAAFKAHLETAGVEVRPYLGEFDSADTMEGIVKEGNQIIFYDLKGDLWQHQFRKRVDYSLYFVGCTASKNPSYRQKTKSDLINLIEKIDEKFLTFVCSAVSEYSKQRTLKKLQDGFSDFGYLVVYERNFDVEFTLKGDEDE
jgi:hypothetical protein